VLLAKLTMQAVPAAGKLVAVTHQAALHPTSPLLQLYSHHVLARLASNAEEAAGAGSQGTRTLPSFWAAKAALERQRQRCPRRHKGGEQAGGEEGEEEEPRPRRKRARTAADGGEGSVDGMEVDQSEGEEQEESLSSFR